jgi:hypothetical protein
MCLLDKLSNCSGPDGGWVCFIGGMELMMIVSPTFYQEAAVLVVAKDCVQAVGVED